METYLEMRRAFIQILPGCVVHLIKLSTGYAQYSMQSCQRKKKILEEGANIQVRIYRWKLRGVILYLYIS